MEDLSPEQPVQKSPKNLTLAFFKVIRFSIVSLFICSILILLSYIFVILMGEKENPAVSTISQFHNLLAKSEFKLDTFASKDEFKQYLEAGLELSESYPRLMMGMARMDSSLEQTAEFDFAVGEKAPTGEALPIVGNNQEMPGRTSETNVQVAGIDEPDIVKVSNRTIFTSFASSFIRPFSQPDPVPLPEPILMREDSVGISADIDIIRPPIRYDYETQIINAFPPEEIEKLGGINKIGDLLVYKDTLVILTYEKVYGYDVSDKSSPKQLWEISYKNQTNFKDARLLNDTLYLVTQNYTDRVNPCPYVPVFYEGKDFSIPCTEISHPRRVVSADTTFSVLKINIQTGKIEDSISFVGSGAESVLYMSENNLYLTYSYSEDAVEIFKLFINENAMDLFSEDVKGQLTRLATYNISNRAKIVEMELILEKFLNSLDEDERMKIENEIQNRMQDFVKIHARDFYSTGIVKINVKNLTIDSTGVVPGRPLNQFSLDEYNNNLRIATNSAGASMWIRGESVNDVYVLSESLNTLGSVKDLGKGERIYSARFIGDKGYIVTFKQTDPFYVLDLSKPTNPQLKGELKIPGYSSYLHPISSDLILGTGKEDSNVKLSLFDVSNPEEPKEADKYLLNEYWSDILNTHHAFLLDTRHKVFFLPGSKGGYIFSYDNDELTLEKTVSSTGVKRAVYIDDYMYIIGERGINVINEKTWEEVKDFEY